MPITMPYDHNIALDGYLETLAGAGYIEMNKQEIRNAVIQNLSSEPSSPLAGQVFFNTAKADLVSGAGKFGYRSASSWVYPDMQKSVYDTNNNGKVDTAENAELLGGADLAAVLNLANATGTLPDARLSNVGTAGSYNYVTTDAKGRVSAGSLKNLNEICGLKAVNGSVDMNNQKIVNLASPSTATDAVNKQYVDDKQAGISWKLGARVATTGNITLSGLQTIDGVAVANGDRVLVRLQTASAQNGIYSANSSAWTRTSDSDTWTKVVSACIAVAEGTSLHDTRWNCVADEGGTMGTSAIVWTDFGGASYSAGAGLTLNSNQFSVVVDNETVQISGNALAVKLATSGGIVKNSTNGIMINLDETTLGLSSGVAGIKSDYRFKHYLGVITANGTATSWQITHGLNTTYMVWKVVRQSDGLVARPGETVSDANNVVFTFNRAPANGTVYHVNFIGKAA